MNYIVSTHLMGCFRIEGVWHNYQMGQVRFIVCLDGGGKEGEWRTVE